MRLTGPAMSLGASGSMAKTLVFSIWKGQPYGRLHVTPVNRNTTGQNTVRSVLGTIAKACRVVLTSAGDSVNHVGSAFFQAGNTKAPAGQSWISYLQKSLNSGFAALRVSFEADTSTIKGYYETEAGDLGMSAYIDKKGVTQSPGLQLYLLASFATASLGYAGFTGGIDAATSAQLTAFGTYLHTTTG